MQAFRINGHYFTLAPQTASILRHLKDVGDISGVEAAAIYKSRSLTKRISEINDALPLGVEVHSEWSRDMTGQRYKRYYLPVETRMGLHFGAPA